MHIDNKVFCIGFHKTGTSSIGEALKILGYKVKGYSPEILDNSDGINYTTVEKLTNEFSAFQDNPWPVLYKHLYNSFPSSKFILTIRESNNWYNSINNHFAGKKTRMRRLIYGNGDPEYNKELYINVMENHNKEVMSFFKDKPKSLLVINLAETKNKWKSLCQFLDLPVPKSKFPHANRREVRTWWGTILTKVKHKYNLDLNF